MDVSAFVPAWSAASRPCGSFYEDVCKPYSKLQEESICLH